MYIKKILFFILLAGLVVGGIFAYMVYNSIFAPNTSFSNDQAYIFIPSDAGFEDVKQQLSPLLQDMDSFRKVADRKGYISNIKAGKYAIKKGMNNNEIINSVSYTHLRAH